MARTFESGYKTQMLILLALREFGPLSCQDIIEKTGIGREELWRNLKVLERKKIINREKVGFRTMNKVAVKPETLEWIISILFEGGLRAVTRKMIKAFRKGLKAYYQLMENKKIIERYETEIVELSYAEKRTLHNEDLKFAKERKRIKKDKLKAKQTWPYLSESLEKETRERFTQPINPRTKIVELSSGIKVKIRGLSMLEHLQIDTKSEKKPLSKDIHIEEAIEKLRS